MCILTRWLPNTTCTVVSALHASKVLNNSTACFRRALLPAMTTTVVIRCDLGYNSTSCGRMREREKRGGTST